MKTDEVFDILHKQYGYCGHCGKKECSGKSSNSKLPAKINLDIGWFYAELEKLEQRTTANMRLANARPN